MTRLLQWQRSPILRWLKSLRKKPVQLVVFTVGVYLLHRDDFPPYSHLDQPQYGWMPATGTLGHYARSIFTETSVDCFVMIVHQGRGRIEVLVRDEHQVIQKLLNIIKPVTVDIEVLPVTYAEFKELAN